METAILEKLRKIKIRLNTTKKTILNFEIKENLLHSASLKLFSSEEQGEYTAIRKYDTIDVPKRRNSTNSIFLEMHMSITDIVIESVEAIKHFFSVFA